MNILLADIVGFFNETKELIKKTGYYQSAKKTGLDIGLLYRFVNDGKYKTVIDNLEKIIFINERLKDGNN